MLAPPNISAFVRLDLALELCERIRHSFHSQQELETSSRWILFVLSPALPSH